MQKAQLPHMCGAALLLFCGYATVCLRKTFFTVTAADEGEYKAACTVSMFVNRLLSNRTGKTRWLPFFSAQRVQTDLNPTEYTQRVAHAL